MKRFWILLLFFCIAASYAQTSGNAILKVHFLYGSKPTWKYRKTEKKEFGGLHGGHVTLQVNDLDYGFERSGGFHVFSHGKKYKAKFSSEPVDSINEKHRDKKTATFLIPLTGEQLLQLNAIHNSYCHEVPYDYAFFGMRCAASVREILGQIGIIKQRKRFFYITGNFYPKKLRKKLFRLAKEKNYAVLTTEGSERRKWEGK